MGHWPIAAAKTKSFADKKSGPSKVVPEVNSRLALEMAEARELFATYQITKKKVMTAERQEFIERMYGAGAVKRIVGYMTQLDNGEIT